MRAAEFFLPNWQFLDMKNTLLFAYTQKSKQKFVVTSALPQNLRVPAEFTFARLSKYQRFTAKNPNKFDFYRQILVCSKFL